MPIKRQDESEFERATARDNAKSKRTALDSISRLPEHARNEISRALSDGRTWRHVAKLCEKHGLKNVQAQNVTNFRNSKTHLSWLARQERIAAIRADQAEGREIFDAAIEDGMNPADAACLVASRKMLATIADLDLSVIHEAATLNPKLYIELIRTAAAMSKTLKPGKSQRGREASAQPIPGSGGLSAEEKTRKMKEFFGAV